MSTVALSGNDVVNINNRVFADVADGDFANLTFPNEIATVKTGKNGNSIYALNATGKQADLALRVIRGSADDKFLNNLMAQQEANFSGFVLMIGEFIKKIGDGLGNIQSDTYIMSGGIFTKKIEAKSNAEGDTEQSVAIYMLRFANAPRTLT
jgi:hypothetical protein